jgi:hypothetical protein
MTSSTFNIFGMALAGVQPARSHPPAMRPCGAIPSFSPNPSGMAQERLGGIDMPPTSFRGLCNTAKARCKGNGFLPRLLLMTFFALLAGVLLQGCESQIDFGVECQVLAEGRVS